MLFTYEDCTRGQLVCLAAAGACYLAGWPALMLVSLGASVGFATVFGVMAGRAFDRVHKARGTISNPTP